MDINELFEEYGKIKSQALSLESSVSREINKLVQENEIVLGVPIESRVKDWDSIQQKLQRKEYNFKSLADLDDLIGIRVILLFKTDAKKIISSLEKSFDVLESQDTADRLGESEFGYQSHHMTMRLPQSWTKIPTMKGLGKLKVEVQVRTLAQHIWAAASHKLQYKQEASVPKPVKRTINRVSALLETVDLELERVLVEKNEYRSADIPRSDDAEPLNVDSIEIILNDFLPSSNKADNEPYDKLLTDLLKCKVTTVGELKKLLVDNLDHMMQAEKSYVEMAGKGDTKLLRFNAERNSRGVYFTQVGLVRQALVRQFDFKDFALTDPEK